MKYTVKISNISFDMELIPKVEDVAVIVPDTEIPVIVVPDPPIVEKPVIDESIIDITQTWYNTFKNGSGTLTLESGKTYSLSTVKRQNINGKLRILTTGKDPAYLWVGKEMYRLYIDSGEDTVLFNLQDGADILIKNIYPSLRNQDRNVQQMYSVNWFSSVQDKNAKWTAIVKDCDTTKLAKNGGFGTGLIYGGIYENYIAFINYKHSGPMIAELKNPWENGVLYWVMDNVSTDYKDPFEWSKRAHLTKGTIRKDTNRLSLTGSILASCLYNHFFNEDKGSNRSTILHIGRFTFMIDSIDAVIDTRIIQLRPSPKTGEKVLLKNGRFFFQSREAHAGDYFTINGNRFTIKEKLKTENDEWTNNFGKGTSPLTVKAPQCFVNEKINLVDGEYLIETYQSSFDLYDSVHPIYLIYKDDFNFRTISTTKFGDYEVLNARGGDHIAYNHREISIWAKDTDLNSGMPQGNNDPYYRESTLGKGKSLGYNIVNCTGFDDEFSDKVITTDKPMPERVAKIIS